MCIYIKSGQNIYSNLICLYLTFNYILHSYINNNKLVQVWNRGRVVVDISCWTVLVKNWTVEVVREDETVPPGATAIKLPQRRDVASKVITLTSPKHSIGPYNNACIYPQMKPYNGKLAKKQRLGVVAGPQTLVASLDAVATDQVLSLMLVKLSLDNVPADLASEDLVATDVNLDIGVYLGSATVTKDVSVSTLHEILL